MDPRRLKVLLGHLDAYIQDIENFGDGVGRSRGGLVSIPAYP